MFTHALGQCSWSSTKLMMPERAPREKKRMKPCLCHIFKHPVNVAINMVDSNMQWGQEESLVINILYISNYYKRIIIQKFSNIISIAANDKGQDNNLTFMSNKGGLLQLNIAHSSPVGESLDFRANDQLSGLTEAECGRCSSTGLMNFRPCGPHITSGLNSVSPASTPYI